METQKYELLSVISLSSEDMRVLLVCLFYHAECVAFSTSIVHKSFGDVGSWPWNPEEILGMCKCHYPAQKQHDANDKPTNAIKIHKELP